MSASTIQILLVTDDACAGAILRALSFTNHPCRLSVVDTIRKARAVLEVLPPDIVIADLDRLDGSGLELARSDELGETCPLVLLTDGTTCGLTATPEADESTSLHFVAKSETAAVDWSGIVERVWSCRHDEAGQRVEDHSRQRTERLANDETFGAEIAHGLKGPLSSIAVYAGRAMKCVKDAGNSQTLEECLQVVRSQAERCGQVVKAAIQGAVQRDSLKCSRDLRQVVEQAQALVQTNADRNGVTVDLDLCDDMPTVFIHETQIVQAIANLIDNAVEASSNGTVVRLVVDHRNDEARVIVRDWGRGIKKIDLEHIFEPFFTTRQDQGGTGLGLSIAHKSVLQHCGTIGVTSERGVGTEFTVSLPIDCHDKERNGTEGRLDL